MTKKQFAEIAAELPADAIISGNYRGGYIFLSATRNQYNFKSYEEAVYAIKKTKADIKKLYTAAKKITNRGNEIQAI